MRHHGAVTATAKLTAAADLTAGKPAAADLSGTADVVLSAAVMTHRRRQEAAFVLRDRHPELDFVVVLDPQPDAERNALRTARLAWQAVGADATHHLVVQDDMRLVDGFAERARRAAAAMPGQILCLFTEWGSRTSHAVRLAGVEGASWVPVVDPYIPSAAILLPAQVARELAAYPPDPADSTVADDVLLLRYVREHNLVPYVSVPNLAEHAPVDSLMGNDLIMGVRHSALYGGRLHLIPELDARISRLAVIPHLLMFEGLSICHLRDSPTSAQWRTVKTHDYLAQYGITLAQLLEWFTKAMAEFDGDAQARSHLGESLLLQFWLTALAYGVAAGQLVGDLAELDDALTRPLVAEALRTLGPGTLRRFAPAALLDRLPELLSPIVYGAIRSGFTVLR
jgi:hypothetical protein